MTKAPSNPGAVVNPGVPLMRIEYLSRFRLAGSVGEEDVASVALGAPGVVRYLDQTVTEKVTAMVPSLDQNTRRAPVEIEVPNAPGRTLLGYGFVRARIDSKQDVPARKIPPAVRRPGSQDEVVTLVGGNVHVVRVAHSTLNDGSWIVRSGLSEADMVLLSSSSELREGDLVAATSEAPATSASAACAPKASPSTQ